MYIKRIKSPAIILMIIGACVGLLFIAIIDRGEVIDPPDQSSVHAVFIPGEDGIIYQLIDGDAYKIRNDGKLEFAQHVYDVDFYQKNYREIDGKIFRVNNAGNSLIPTLAYFEENFEDTDSLQNLLMQNESDEAGWTGFTLQSPRAPGVSDYIKLKQCTSKKECDFLDNRVEPSDTVAHAGARSLRTYSVPPSFGVPVAKASLDTELLHYKKGDTVWFSAWYYIEKGMPTSIMDIESSWMTGYPGMRIFVDESGLPSLELKAFSTPHFKQRGETVLLPIGKWFHIKTHFYLSEKEDGLAELWLDGQKIISGIGQTLPLADTVYNNLEVGISANAYDTNTILYVDDIVISHEPI